MTVSSANNRNNYTGNGAADTYSYTFKIFSDTDLLVTQRDTADVETTLVLDTDYTVTGAGDVGGGTIVLTAGNLTTDYKLTIRRVRPLTQETDVRNQGDFFAEGHEDAFDHHVMIDQQQQDEIDRSLKIPETVTGFDSELPVPVADRVLRFNGDADGIEAIDVGSAILAVPASESVDADKLDVTDIIAMAAKLAVLTLTGGTLTGTLALASLTTTERDALTPANGMVIYNTTLNDFQMYQNSAWLSLSSITGTETLTNKTLTLPTIGDQTNANHDHADASGGGNLGQVQVTDVTVTGSAASPPDVNTLVKESIVKAWVKFDGTGTVSITDSYNVASVADTAVGKYTITWDTDFANANYVVVGTGEETSGGTVPIICVANGGQAVGTVNIVTTDAAGSDTDFDVIHIIAIGDQ